MKVMVAGGGTGGHFYPALAVIEALVERDPATRVAYVGTRRGIEGRVLPSCLWVRFFPIHIEGLQRGSRWQNAWALLLLMMSFVESAIALVRFRPQVVLGVGGYSSFPLLLLGALLGRVFPIRTVIHEQNAAAGLTNRILARYVDLVLVSFPQSRSQFSRARRIAVTGNPVREAFSQSRRTDAVYESFGLQPDRRTVLVFGGSGGSVTFIDQVLTAKEALARDEDTQILLVIGAAGEEETVRAKLDEAGVRNVSVRRYIGRMADAFAIADLIVSRAGATTLAEITACGKAALLIPWRGATDDHQWKNACLLKAEAACAVADEEVIVRRGLLNVVREIVHDGEILARLERNAWRVGQRHAKHSIIGEIDALMKGARA